MAFIKNHQAEKILRGIVEYNGNLDFEDIMNLVEYEYSIKNLVSPMLVQENNNLFSFPDKKEKESLMEDITQELNSLDEIKKYLNENRANSGYDIAENENGGNL